MLHCRKSVYVLAQDDVVHQTVFPHEKVGSGDETSLTCSEY